MIVVIESPPLSVRAIAGVKAAADLTADIALVGDAVGLARRGALDGFCGTAHALEDDLRERGIPESELERGVRLIDRVELRRLIEAEGRVEGEF